MLPCDSSVPLVNLFQYLWHDGIISLFFSNWDLRTYTRNICWSRHILNRLGWWVTDIFLTYTFIGSYHRLSVTLYPVRWPLKALCTAAYMTTGYRLPCRSLSTLICITFVFSLDIQCLTKSSERHVHFCHFSHHTNSLFSPSDGLFSVTRSCYTSLTMWQDTCHNNT